MQQSELRLITILLIAIIGLTDSGTEIYIPTLPMLVDYFDSTTSTISYTISVYLLGYCIAAPLYGPLSDAFGRRKLFIYGLLIFTLGNLLSSFAFSTTMLIVARFITGIGLTVGYVVGVAVVRDLYSREEYSRVMSMIHMSVAIAPALAPILGSYIGVYLGWQANFMLLTIGGFILTFFVLKMPETLHEDRRKPFKIDSLLRTYLIILKDRKFVGYAFISGVMYSGVWLYYAELPYIFDKLFIPTISFGYYQALIALIFVFGAYFNNKTVHKLGIDTVFKICLSIAFIGALLFLAFSYLPLSGYGMCLAFSVYAFSLGGIYANASTYVMDRFPNLSGASSSALSGIENLVPAIFLTIMANFFDQTPFPVAIGLLIASSLAILVHKFIKDDIKSSAVEGNPIRTSA